MVSISFVRTKERERSSIICVVCTISLSNLTIESWKREKRGWRTSWRKIPCPPLARDVLSRSSRAGAGRGMQIDVRGGGGVASGSVNLARTSSA